MAPCNGNLLSHWTDELRWLRLFVWSVRAVSQRMVIKLGIALMGWFSTRNAVVSSVLRWLLLGYCINTFLFGRATVVWCYFHTHVLS